MFLDLAEQLECVYGTRIALRPVCLSDAWQLFDATRTPDFNKHLAWSQPAEPIEAALRVRAIMEASRKGRLTAVSAVQVSDGAWVGLFRFLPTSDADTIEVGIWVHPRFWSKGHALEITRLCFDVAFKASPITRIVGLALPENEGCCHLMELLGMSDIGAAVRIAENGRRLDVREYEVTREQWRVRDARRARTNFLQTDQWPEELEKGYKVVGGDDEPTAHDAYADITDHGALDTGVSEEIALASVA